MTDDHKGGQPGGSDSVSVAVDRACLGVAFAGALAAVGVHVAAWLGLAAGFEAGVLLMAGCGLVIVRVATSTQPALGGGAPAWRAVASRLPRWLGALRVPLMYYALGYWAYVMYLHLVMHADPSQAVWARFYSAFAATFYFFGGATIWAALKRPAVGSGE